ncbi:right-handed parallel beta-helix repeat-containing protein [Halomicrobium salinisoli]|uniref:right-handed parallel beta-helix repeat-containing protein n=1 Tax=Halomicrobium salinisoli TaxID=2878391 RepID=UPI001CF077F4|nr:right-handed parallel beta-helix repeat-containing protein [Halomicrobium salinisoli]
MPRDGSRVAAVVGSLLLVASAAGLGWAATGAAVAQETETAQGPTEIDSCTTITEPGSYVLSADLESENGTCIEVEADDVVLDGNGHAIAGGQNESDVAAFREASLAPSVIFSENGTAADETLVAAVLENYPVATNERWANVGVAANGSENVTVRDVDVTGLYFGVYLEGVSDVRLENVTAESNADGMDVFNATNVTVADSRLVDNQWGLWAVNVTESNVTNVTAESNGVNAVGAVSAPGLAIDGATVSGSPVGIELLASNDSRVRNATVTGSAYTGVGVLGSDGVAVTDSAVADTTGEVPDYLADLPAPYDAPAGINLDDASGGEYRNVTLTNNTEWAFHATNESTDNALETVRIDGTTVGGTVSDAALRTVADPSVTDGVVVNDLYVTATDGTASVDLEVTSDGATSSVTIDSSESVDAAFGDGDADDDAASDDVTVGENATSGAINVGNDVTVEAVNVGDGGTAKATANVSVTTSG